MVVPHAPRTGRGENATENVDETDEANWKAESGVLGRAVVTIGDAYHIPATRTGGGCGCVSRGLGCAVCGNPLGVERILCATHGGPQISCVFLGGSVSPAPVPSTSVSPLSPLSPASVPAPGISAPSPLQPSDVVGEDSESDMPDLDEVSNSSEEAEAGPNAGPDSADSDAADDEIRELVRQAMEAASDNEDAMIRRVEAEVGRALDAPVPTPITEIPALMAAMGRVQGEIERLAQQARQAQTEGESGQDDEDEVEENEDTDDEEEEQTDQENQVDVRAEEETQPLLAAASALLESAETRADLAAVAATTARNLQEGRVAQTERLRNAERSRVNDNHAPSQTRSVDWSQIGAGSDWATYTQPTLNTQSLVAALQSDSTATTTGTTSPAQTPTPAQEPRDRAAVRRLMADVAVRAAVVQPTFSSTTNPTVNANANPDGPAPLPQLDAMARELVAGRAIGDAAAPQRLTTLQVLRGRILEIDEILSRSRGLLGERGAGVEGSGADPGGAEQGEERRRVVFER
ncbi:hypothetical protein MIND_00927600 [Mycena indigotica]|uniref:Uncharacterized protein n=1 Tax=Mycena indigotica TaxID=2126181 RepID=A0A8H6VYX7_9AGAR|nr:uncharacterized protein MIND_00927600 [Mycena indigotica]KAF7296956.1 hypothetical protein MIND_00927600 [Mycena indigotica]